MNNSQNFIELVKQKIQELTDLVNSYEEAPVEEVEELVEEESAINLEQEIAELIIDTWLETTRADDDELCDILTNALYYAYKNPLPQDICDTIIDVYLTPAWEIANQSQKDYLHYIANQLRKAVQFEGK